jgi:pSer/pThr/pTyr-binding forkhead associated (FHA) protein
MKSTIKIGRDTTNDIVINEPRVSRSHALITINPDGTYEVKDLSSTNGTFINGQRITQPVLILPEDKLEVAGCWVDWFSFIHSPKQPDSSGPLFEEPYAKIRKTITVGSFPDNDIIIQQEFVSKHHATLSRLKNKGYYIKDSGSSNGTFVNGVRIQAKNITSTDFIKVGQSDLPSGWFKHKKLRPHIIRDHKKTLLTILAVLVVCVSAVLYYFYSCEWFDCRCNLSSEKIYAKNKNSIVLIFHSYYYTIETNGKKYYVGKNKFFGGTEANTETSNILPYASISGSGCFVKNDGTILTSQFLINPWLNQADHNRLIREVIVSKTIDHFSASSDYRICGETSELKWIPMGAINNLQNYTAGIANRECNYSDSASFKLQSIKQTLPKNATVISYVRDNRNKKFQKITPEIYFGSLTSFKENKVLQDTFYAAGCSYFKGRLFIRSLNSLLPDIPEGSPVINERGELIGVFEQGRVVLIMQFIKNINK